MIRVVVKNKDDQRVLEAKRGEGVREVLERNGVMPHLPCAGEGRCGKCRVRFDEGAPFPNERDRALISKKELEEGVRLLCRAVPEEDCRIDVTGVLEQEMKILAIDDAPQRALLKDGKKGKCAVAVDLGTTTIAATCLVRVGDAVEAVKSASTVNHQNVYGLDVISRISQAEVPEKAAKMRAIVCEDIFSLVKELLAKSDTDEMSASDIDFIAIAGNTTMLHLLTGKRTDGLGKYPYTPVCLEPEVLDGSFISESLRGVRVDILPGISAFVGADIVAGLYYLSGTEKDSFMMLDLGTNGEIAFFDGGRIDAASTAAGPVFEAGGISCGMASMKGAICSARVQRDSTKAHGFWVDYATIGGGMPRGVCGTGLMELVSEFVRVGIIDHTGLIEERFFDEGIPVTEDGRMRLTQKDIRNFQLGKAAVFSGISTLLRGRMPEKIFLSGGFGNAINCERIKNLGMYPGEFNGRIVASGNTALKGCVKYASAHLLGKEQKEAARKELGQIRERSEVTVLSDTDGFDEMFLQAMNFGKREVDKND